MEISKKYAAEKKRNLRKNPPKNSDKYRKKSKKDGYKTSGMSENQDANS